MGARTEITYHDVNELKYCSSIFKESLRLFPPADALQRETVDEMIINGYKIPSNTNVIVKFFIRLIVLKFQFKIKFYKVSSFLNGRHEGYFVDPLIFRPERFMKDSDSIESSFIFF